MSDFIGSSYCMVEGCRVKVKGYKICGNCQTKALRKEVATLTAERDRLRGIFKPIEERARLTFELATMEVLIDENAKKGSDRLAQIIVAWSEETQRAEQAEESNRVMREHLIFIGRVCTGQNQIADVFDDTEALSWLSKYIVKALTEEETP
jgi:hypothetical protein